MEATIKKWGNSLGIRFPKIYAKEAGITNGSKVEISIEDGKVIIEPILEKDQTLEDLLERVTINNIHSEIETKKTGEEIW